MINPQETESVDPRVFKDVFDGLRKQDSEALVRALDRTHEGEAIRSAVEHIIYIDSQYIESPHQQ